MSLVGLPQKSNKPALLRVVLLLLALVLLAACTPATSEPHPGQQTDESLPGFFPLPPVSQEGAAVYNLYPIVFWTAVAIFVLVEGILIVAVLRFRRRPREQGGELPPQTHGNNLLEVIWTAVPAAIVTLLFVMTVNTLASVERLEPQPEGVVVDVVGFQWQWTLRYEDEGLEFTGVGREGPVMVIPAGESVRVRLHSLDVIHSFYVPQILYKKDVVPGRVNEFDMIIDQPGFYRGQCAEFCGLAHTDMYFAVEAVPRGEYDAWVEQAQAGATPGGAAATPSAGSPPAAGASPPADDGGTEASPPGDDGGGAASPPTDVSPSP